MTRSENREALATVARALGNMLAEVVFVGGSVTELYATDPAAGPVRPTLDVDCVVEVASRAEYRKLEERLRERGFRHDTSQGAPVCRWLCAGVHVDVMPTEGAALGFANRWHQAAMNHSFRRDIGGDVRIAILKPPFFLASKLEAMKGRGGEDRRGKPDFEDVIFVVDNRAEVACEVAGSPEPVRGYVQANFAALLDDAAIREDLASVIAPDAGAAGILRVLRRIREIAGAPF